LKLKKEAKYDALNSRQIEQEKIKEHKKRAKDDERDPKNDEREEQLEAKILTHERVQ
jgi:hypothetical protein